ncbi:MAG TPA: HEPN domain-containing protein [Dehalococcoidia bacterium]|jgi:HEPN domain-containing protein|nr:HEPN domain-containing protein [Dehalococcoidia bacterium]
MRPAEQAERWLAQAEDDLRWASHLKDAGAYNLACFLSQQVAEKAMSALLYRAGREVVLGHSVQDLCAQVAEVWPQVRREQCERWSALDGYYLSTRYPDALPGGLPARAYDRHAAEDAVSAAVEAVDAARRIVRG